VAYFLPQIIKGIGLSVFVTAIPAVVGVAGMLTSGFVCDRTSDKRLLCGSVLMIAAIGVAESAGLVPAGGCCCLPP
jgi:hypothetical protein